MSAAHRELALLIQPREGLAAHLLEETNLLAADGAGTVSSLRDGIQLACLLFHDVDIVRPQRDTVPHNDEGGLAPAAAGSGTCVVVLRMGHELHNSGVEVAARAAND